VRGLAVALLAAAAAAGPLPPPLPPPGAPPAPAGAASEVDDPLDVLWGHRLVLGPGGAPLVSIRLMEGRPEIAFQAHGRARLRARGGAALEVPAGERFRVTAEGALPAALAHHALLAEAPHADRGRVEAARQLWTKRGARVVQRVVGGVYGLGGRVVDNRRVLLLAEGDGSARAARAFADEALAAHGSRTEPWTEVVRRPAGKLLVHDAAGGVVARGDALVALEVEGDAGFTVAQVEHDVGGTAHGFEDRTYRGRLLLTLDASGRLAAVLALELEELLRGLVPSEMPASVARDALKAQAVTARSNVLAQVGTRHLGDPYALCSEVHCQAYRGASAQVPATDAAVRETRGEALFARGGGGLVDAVYSALCGGHGEDNDAVWSLPPDPSLRGRADLPPAEALRFDRRLSDVRRLRAFLAASPPAWCARGTGPRRDRYRWERRFAPAELDALLAPLGVGHVRTLEVTRRGVSGRARLLVVHGDAGDGAVEGELRIRRLLGNLPSAMFVVEREGEAIRLRGGGWGHGAGMCQWGAVSRAEAGHDYREILRAYYAGAEPARLY
jgi:SpoIID/LytB domain protein